MNRSLSLGVGLWSSMKTLGFCGQRASESTQVDFIVKVHVHAGRNMTVIGLRVGEW